MLTGRSYKVAADCPFKGETFELEVIPIDIKEIGDNFLWWDGEKNVLKRSNEWSKETQEFFDTQKREAKRTKEFFRIRFPDELDRMLEGDPTKDMRLMAWSLVNHKDPYAD